MGVRQDVMSMEEAREGVLRVLLLERRLWVARVSSPGVALVALSTVEVLLRAGRAEHFPRGPTKRAMRIVSGLKRRAVARSTANEAYLARASAFACAIVIIDRDQGRRIAALVDSAILRFRGPVGGDEMGGLRLALESEREAFVLRHMKLVVDAARALETDRASFEDLVHEGVVGLLRSVDRFHETRDVPYAVYAGWWIRASMRAHLREAETAPELAASHVDPDELPCPARNPLDRLLRDEDDRARASSAVAG